MNIVYFRLKFYKKETHIYTVKAIYIFFIPSKDAYRQAENMNN